MILAMIYNILLSLFILFLIPNRDSIACVYIYIYTYSVMLTHVYENMRDRHDTRTTIYGNDKKKTKITALHWRNIKIDRNKEADEDIFNNIIKQS